MAVTLTQLSAFLTVMRRGSVTAAAEELFVTQPSVSAAVAALEREVGAKLLERDGRGLRPTEAGATFAPYAAHVLGLLEQGSRAAREAGDGRRVGESFAVNEIVLVTAPDDPLAKRRWVAVEELAGRSWLLREPGSGSRAMADEWLSQRGLVPSTLTLG